MHFSARCDTISLVLLERIGMKVSYKKLWKLLIDKEMNKTDLRNATGISSATIAKKTNSEEVTMSVLTKICEVLNCNIGDVMDFVQDAQQQANAK